MARTQRTTRFGGPGRTALLLLCGLAAGCSRPGAEGAGQPALLHVSFDPTRELLADYGARFNQDREERGLPRAELRSSHGGSGRQARAVIEGLEADVVSLALASDVDAIATQSQLLPADWRERLPHGAVPFTSAVVFLVRAGNPRAIHGWSDLVRPGIEVIVPNPKTSGGGRLAYAAAWGQALLRDGGSAAQAFDYVNELYRHVPVLDAGARGASTSFLERSLGDVLLTWESEALLLAGEVAPGRVELVRPDLTVLAEPRVALVERVAERRGTSALARDYLLGLFSTEGQELAARHHYRPHDPALLARRAADFPSLRLFTLEQALGDDPREQARHFGPDGLFDRILAAQARGPAAFSQAEARR